MMCKEKEAQNVYGKMQYCDECFYIVLRYEECFKRIEKVEE
jgi:hypothetical protein